MVQDKDLKSLKDALETYFTYDPLGPSAIKLEPGIAKKLLNLLNNLDTMRVCRIIRKEDLTFFPENELMKYVKADIATAIANYLIENDYVKILYEDNTVDPSMQHIYGSVMAIKQED